jgi:hypothetical protein
VSELKCCCDGIKRGAVVMSLQKLKQRALDNPEVKAEYERLAAEFDCTERQLLMRTQEQTNAKEALSIQHSAKAQNKLIP